MPQTTMKILFKNEPDITINDIQEFQTFLFRSDIRTTKKLICVPDHIKEKLQLLLSTTKSISFFQLKNKIKQIFNGGSHRTVQFWLNRGYTMEEARHEVSSLQKRCSQKLYENKKINPEKYIGMNPKTVQYWNKKGYSNEEAKKIISNLQRTFSLEKCIKQHGEDVGKKIWIERQKKWMASFLNRTEEDLKIIYKSKGKTKLQLVEKHGLEKAEAICKSKSVTYERMLKKYGKDAADKFQHDRLQRIRSFTSKKVSKISMELFNEIMNYEFIGKDHVLYGENELCIKNPNKKFYLFDFAINSENTKKIIEFHGDFIHANPEKYLSDWFHPLKKITAKEIWNQDELKRKEVERLGFEYMIVWESQYKTRKTETITNCLRFLNEKN
jgi:hypothetical protein